MAEESKKTQVAIMGAGPGGYAAAFRAADLGLDVTLIDPRENPGGVCLYQGCIPTKTLLHFTDVMDETQHAKEWGLQFDKLSVDLDKLRKFKERVVNKLTRGLGSLAKNRKVKYLRATARFKDENTLELTDTDGNSSLLQFEKAIIATGARSRPLPGVDFDGDRIMSSRHALEMKELPEKLLVVGAGYIGLEMGVIYHTLKSKVTIVEATADIMPGMDRDLADVFRKERKDLLKGIRFNTKVTEAKVEDDKVKVSMENKDGEKEEDSFDAMLVAIGQVPNTEDLGLDNIDIKTNDNGFIDVNVVRQTGKKHIYAIGDITGEPLLAHKASHEGRVAAEHIAGEKTAYEPQTIPSIVYVGLAWTGLTETQAKEQGREVKVTRFPWAASGRAVSQGKKNGLTKLIFDPDTERLLGAGFAGNGADVLVAEATLAIEMGAVAKDLELTVHPHPTLSETIMEAAEMFHGQATHAMKQK